MNRTTFQKRQREMKQLEKRRLKAERRAQKKLARNAEDGARSPHIGIGATHNAQIP
jgi:hypothetical protein